GADAAASLAAAQPDPVGGDAAAAAGFCEAAEPEGFDHGYGAAAAAEGAVGWRAGVGGGGVVGVGDCGGGVGVLVWATAALAALPASSRNPEFCRAPTFSVRRSC